MKIYVATTNKHKIEEIQNILSFSDLEILPHESYELLKTEESSSTFEGNAALKAIALSMLTDEYVIADDSGLAVDHLNGAPGVYSARFAGENASDRDNNEKLLKCMAGAKNRHAKFICAIALAKSGVIIEIFKSECEGSIGDCPKGENGFGYDPIFVLPNGKHMAEISEDQKNNISHRKKALNKLSKYLKEHIWKK